jgi:hypothetical protein
MNPFEHMGDSFAQLHNANAAQLRLAGVSPLHRGPFVTDVPPHQTPMPPTISGIDRAALPCGCRLDRRHGPRECGEWQMRELLVDYGDRVEIRTHWRRKG